MKLERRYPNITGLIEGLTAAANLGLTEVTVTTMFSPRGESFSEARVYILDVAERTSNLLAGAS